MSRGTSATQWSKPPETDKTRKRTYYRVIDVFARSRGGRNKPTWRSYTVTIPTKINNLTINLIYIVVPNLIKDCIIGIDSQEKLKILINTEAKSIKISVNDKSESISYNMMSIIELKQYSSLNIIKCSW